MRPQATATIPARSVRNGARCRGEARSYRRLLPAHEPIPGSAGAPADGARTTSPPAAAKAQQPGAGIPHGRIRAPGCRLILAPEGCAAHFPAGPPADVPAQPLLAGPSRSIPPWAAVGRLPRLDEPGATVRPSPWSRAVGLPAATPRSSTIRNPNVPRAERFPTSRPPLPLLRASEESRGKQARADSLVVDLAGGSPPPDARGSPRPAGERASQWR